MTSRMMAALIGLGILGAAASAMPAQATTIDFSAAGSANYDIVSQDFGDSAEADLSYRTLSGGPNWGQSPAPVAGYVDYWADPSYSHDQAIFAATAGSKLEIGLQAGAGLGFTSVAFDLGGYYNGNVNTAFRLYDAGWNELLSSDSFPIDANAGGLISLAVNTTALYFQMGDDWYAGVRSLSFESTAIAATPIPAALPLFASALGLFGFLGWRRKATAAAA